MNKTTEIFVIITIATFWAFFLVEAPLWMWPFVHEMLIPQLNPDLRFPTTDQAETLRALFINQGIYNLMVAIGGVAGIFLVRRGRVELGRGLVVYTCLFAIGAAVTLLLTTEAYLLGVVQIVFPSVALVRVFRDRSGARL
jgi:putative membrane protein